MESGNERQKSASRFTAEILAAESYIRHVNIKLACVIITNN